MFKISMINNLSARAYTLVAPPFQVELQWNSPTESWRRFAAGHADAALIPVACLPQVYSIAEPLGQFGIGCKNHAYSVLLFCRVPLIEIAEHNYPIHITPESQSGRRLLQLLYQKRFGKTCIKRNVENGTRATLLIGNTALREFENASRYAEVQDMGIWWHECTGYPFVFAQWMVGKHVEPSFKTTLFSWLEKCVIEAESPDGIRRLAEAGICDGLFTGSQEMAFSYYDSIHPRLTHSDIQGRDLFLTEMEKSRHCTKLV